MKGWIKLHRSLIDWEWFDDKNALNLLIYLLISVNYEDKKWRGIVVKSGSMILSWETLSIACKLTVRQCRTAMDKLEQSGEVTRKATNKWQVVTLVKWDKLQGDSEEVDKQQVKPMTNKRQTNDRQMTTTKERKEYKEIKEVKKKEKKGDLIFPWNDERFLDQWNNWLDYKKKEFNFKFKSDQSQQAALKKLATLANGDMENAITMMHESMANGWKGFFAVNKKERSPEETIKKNLKGW